MSKRYQLFLHLLWIPLCLYSSFMLTGCSGGGGGGVDTVSTSTEITTTTDPVLTTITLSPTSVSVVSGATQTFTAIGLDQNGKEISFTPVFSVTPSELGTLTVSGQNAVLTASKKGTGEVKVASASNLSATASITVTTGALNTLVISPTSVTLNKGQTQQFTVYGVDANGNTKQHKFITVSPTWSVAGSIGTVDTNGLYTALFRGTGQCRAEATKSDGTKTSIAADVTVANRNPMISSGLTANPTSLTAGQTSAISVTASDLDGDLLTYSWSASNGTISGTGASVSYTPPSSAGTYTISLSISDGAGGSANGSVNITVTPPSAPTGVSATAGNGQVTISWNTVTGAVSFNLYMASQAGVTKSNYSSKPAGMAHTGVTSPYTHTGLTNGTTYYFVVTAVNSVGESSESSEVTATPTLGTTNQNPIISSGPIANPSSITANGTSTISIMASDPNGDTLSYSWSATGGTISGTSSSVTYTAPSTAGTYVISVTVSDGKGGSATGNVNVTVTLPKTVLKIGTNESRACALLSDKSVKCWGSNSNGQLGNGSIIDSAVPTSVIGISSATDISVGRFHTCAVLSDSSIKCWGRNNAGQLGNGTNNDTTTPVSVTGIANATAVTAGDGHTCALLSNAIVECWGSNWAGQLGNGNTANSSVPVTVTGISNATKIKAGSDYTCTLLTDNTIRCWGANLYGQLGNGNNTSSSTAVSVSGIANAAKISACEWHACAILSDGTVKCWGYNQNGQLGDGTTTSSNVPVSVSGVVGAVNIGSGDGRHSCAVLSSGVLKCWGANDSGQLGDGNKTMSSPIVSVSGISNAVDVATGYVHTCGLLSDGKVKCWGSNGYGQLGDGTKTDSTTPISVSDTLYARLQLFKKYFFAFADFVKNIFWN